MAKLVPLCRLGDIGPRTRGGRSVIGQFSKTRPAVTVSSPQHFILGLSCTLSRRIEVLRGLLRSLLTAFRRSERGGIVVIVALTLPVVTVLGVGAIELQQVVSDKAATQDAADAAALWGA